MKNATMLRLNRTQRTALSDRLRQLANIVLGATWWILVALAVAFAAGSFVMAWGIAGIAAIVLVLDWWDRRKDRHPTNH